MAKIQFSYYFQDAAELAKFKAWLRSIFKEDEYEIELRGDDVIATDSNEWGTVVIDEGRYDYLIESFQKTYPTDRIVIQKPDGTLISVRPNLSESET